MVCANASEHHERLLYVVEYAAKVTTTSNIKDEMPHLFGIVLSSNQSFYDVKML